MAATSIDKDYVHLLLDQVAKRIPNKKVIFRIASFADFERDPLILKESIIDSLNQYNPNIIIFQLGENVDEKNLELFETKYLDLVNTLKKDKEVATICTLPFFPSLLKNNIVTKVATNTKSFVVDLSHLTLIDNTNYAQNEIGYSGDTSAWKVKGIGLHPGDKGMKKWPTNCILH